jgi:thiamine-monophosphate kinase
MGEFDVIKRFFLRPERQLARADCVALGIGDDCALVQARPGTQIAISSDMLVEGHHFFASVDPRALGHKALAVNLSDLAACGAKPLAFTLALALPKIDAAWLDKFSSGLFALSDQQGCELVGGDTTQGPLNICITVLGEIPLEKGQSQALLRSGAKPGDDLYVSGNLGDARLALEVMRGNLQLEDAQFQLARERLERPTPRIELGLALRGIANAAIDVSDGLLGDLRHVLKASGVGATIRTDQAQAMLAAQSALRAALAKPSGPTDTQLTERLWLGYVLAGGDDYELAFTAPKASRNAVAAAAARARTPVSVVGQIDTELGLRLVNAQGSAVENHFAAFDHFA